MGLNKKQKKQIDVVKKKIQGLQQQLAGAKAQPDDPEEVPRLKAEIEKQKELIAQIEKE